MATMPGPIQSEMIMTPRPASQSTTKTNRGRPLIGSRPVQLGTAVRRKPVTAAATVPNIISWKCHDGPAPWIGRPIVP